MGDSSADPKAIKFGQWLKAARKSAELTGEALAEKIGFEKAYVSKLETATGDPKPTLDTLDAIAKALKVDLAVVLNARGYEVLSKPFYPQLQPEEQILLQMFNDLPRECQLDVMASVSGIHRRRSLSAKIVDRHEARANAREDISRARKLNLPPLSRGEEVMEKVELAGAPRPEDFTEYEPDSSFHRATANTKNREQDNSKRRKGKKKAA
jgi:transcriptional regulator with XRE-family HTH domain